MARIKGGLNAKKKHKRILKLAKGATVTAESNAKVMKKIMPYL